MALDGLTQGENTWSPGLERNTVAFLPWDVVRVEDFVVNRLIQREEDFYKTEGQQAVQVSETQREPSGEMARA